eukprot:jgi/Mesvir1/28844/Mv18972-RA.1
MATRGALRLLRSSARLGTASTPLANAIRTSPAVLALLQNGIHKSEVCHPTTNWLRSFRSSAAAAGGIIDPSTVVGTELDPKMFCYQALGQKGCVKIGQCGKTPETAALQDLLIYAVKGLGSWAHYARTKHGIENDAVNNFVHGAMFATLTNVNFDSQRFMEYLSAVEALRNQIIKQVQAKGDNKGPDAPKLPWFDRLPPPAEFSIAEAMGPGVTDVSKMVALAKLASVMHRREVINNDTLVGIHELLTYGLKGMMAYYHHAVRLGQHDASVVAFMQEALAFLCSEDSKDLGKALDFAFRCGENNVKTLALLDTAHDKVLGTPYPAEVRTTPVAGKCILVSGHDLWDLKTLLEQTEGTGINVYTHGEMLPAHGYPELRKHKHLVGHFGGAWMRQQTDFVKFPGAILMTTNCIMEPSSFYRKRIFTTGEVGVSNAPHIPDGKANGRPVTDFSELIECAKREPGFRSTEESPKPVTTGFGHRFVLSIVDKVMGAIQSGDLKHIYLIGGCDGSEMDRSYFTEVAEGLPKDSIILTMGCGKFRVNQLELGTLQKSGLPRLLDMGQCNDSYSAVVVAQALAKALNTDVNSLPLTLIVSWFEQKAVAVLLSLLHLGIKGVRIGPRLPAFLTPEALTLLNQKFDLKPTNSFDAQTDLKAILAGK